MVNYYDNGFFSKIKNYDNVVGKMMYNNNYIQFVYNNNNVQTKK